MWLHVTLPKALKVGKFAVEDFQFSVIKSEKDMFKLEHYCRWWHCCYKNFAEMEILILKGHHSLFSKIIWEMKSLFLPEKGTADQERGFEVILQFMQRSGPQ